MLTQILGVMWGANSSYRRRKRLRETVVCGPCEQSYTIGTRSCGKCGGRELIALADFGNFQNARLNQRSQELTEERRHNKIILRIQALRAATACKKCGSHFSPPIQFCTSCGANIASEHLSDRDIYEVVTRESPKLVPGIDSFMALCGCKPTRGAGWRTFTTYAGG